MSMTGRVSSRTPKDKVVRHFSTDKHNTYFSPYYIAEIGEPDSILSSVPLPRDRSGVLAVTFLLLHVTENHIHVTSAWRGLKKTRFAKILRLEVTAHV
jgi:hypothetical protein